MCWLTNKRLPPKLQWAFNEVKILLIFMLLAFIVAAFWGAPS